MGKVTAGISVSLDGFVTGPNDSAENGLGDGGDALHEWLLNLASFRKWIGEEGGVANRDSEVFAESIKNIGAMVMGRRMYDFSQVPWGEKPPFHVPIFVLTHRPNEQVSKEGGTTFTFVTDGVESALKQARAASGDKEISVASASAIQQVLKAGQLDELQVHVVPVLLGGGVRLFGDLDAKSFKLEIIRVVNSDAITHLKYRVAK